jgi:hypothetical protein
MEAQTSTEPGEIPEIPGRAPRQQQRQAPQNPWDVQGPWTPASVEELKAYAAAHGWSEDFDRWKDEPATVQAWIRENWDPNARMFRSEKTDTEGNRLEGFVEKPVDTPEGWSAWGSNFALRTGDPRLSGGGGAPAVGAGGGAAPVAPTAPAAPVANRGGQLALGENELQNALLTMFNDRSGVFGTGDPYGISTATPRTPDGQPITGVSLKGGGLWWGPEGFEGAAPEDVAPAAALAAPVAQVEPAFAAPAAPPPAPAAPTGTSALAGALTQLPAFNTAALGVQPPQPPQPSQSTQSTFMRPPGAAPVPTPVSPLPPIMTNPAGTNTALGQRLTRGYARRTNPLSDALLDAGIVGA